MYPKSSESFIDYLGPSIISHFIVTYYKVVLGLLYCYVLFPFPFSYLKTIFDLDALSFLDLLLVADILNFIVHILYVIFLYLNVLSLLVNYVNGNRSIILSMIFLLGS